MEQCSERKKQTNSLLKCYYNQMKCSIKIIQPRIVRTKKNAIKNYEQIIYSGYRHISHTYKVRILTS